LLEKEELVRTDNVYLTITDMETFDYVEGRVLVTSGREDEEGYLYCNLSVYYYGVLSVESPTDEITVPQPQIPSAQQAIYYRLYDTVTTTLRELVIDTLKISPKVGKKDFSINLNEPFCRLGISHRALVVNAVFKYQIFARVRPRNLIRAQMEGVDPSETFIRGSFEISRSWEAVLGERLPKELSDPDSATKFFTEMFPILKKDLKVKKIENSIDVSFTLFDFIFEDPSAPAFQLGEYQFGFPVSKDLGNVLRERRGDVGEILTRIGAYLSLMGTEEALRSVVKITESHTEQAKSFPSPMLSGKPYAIYKEFLFSEEVDLFEELPRQIMNFLDERGEGE